MGTKRRVPKKRKVTPKKSKKRASKKVKRRTSKRRLAKRRKFVRKKTKKKARKVSIRGTRAQVFRGTRKKVKTTGQVKKDLMKNKRGKIISKKQHAFGKRSYKSIQKWTEAFVEARKNLGITGFKACKKGTPFYNECQRIYKAKQQQ